jgi:type VI secretion system protein VasG
MRARNGLDRKRSSYGLESGARNVDHIITGTLLPQISRELLGRMASGEAADRLRISIGADGGFAYTFA